MKLCFEMAVIFVTVETKEKLDLAISQYCKDKQLNEYFASKISYNQIIIELLEYANIK